MRKWIDVLPQQMIAYEHIPERSKYAVISTPTVMSLIKEIETATTAELIILFYTLAELDSAIFEKVQKQFDFVYLLIHEPKSKKTCVTLKEIASVLSAISIEGREIIIEVLLLLGYSYLAYPIKTDKYVGCVSYHNGTYTIIHPEIAEKESQVLQYERTYTVKRFDEVLRILHARMIARTMIKVYEMSNRSFYKDMI